MSILDNIRKKISKHKFGAYIVSYGNRYIGQDVLPADRKLFRICGFTGSAGIAAVTYDKIYLMVDGRYELQARRETDPEAVTVLDTTPNIINMCAFIRSIGIEKIGYDAWCYTMAETEAMRRRFWSVEFVDAGNLCGGEEGLPVEVLERGTEFAGLSREEKLSAVERELEARGADYYLFTSADSVSWLMNIYSRELPYSPVVRAYALADKDGNCTIYGDNLQTKLPHGDRTDFACKLESLGEAKLLCDTYLAPEKIRSLISKNTKLIKAPDICRQLKTEKNETELKGMIACHIRDGVALSKFLCKISEGYAGLTELDVVRMLHEYRSAQENFFSESFGTIAAYGKNGAVVHYQPDENSNLPLEDGSLLLIDSGAQYFDGTTDVTRTIALGTPTEEMKHDFTTVLKAHIALATARFPEGTPGMRLDSVARSKVWHEGLDYKHGTGHGVACFGNVHEGPVNISSGSGEFGLKANMVTSDEPGVYKEGKYGIRTENLLYIRKSAFDGFLEFEPLTVVPIDKRLVDKYMLDDGELAWLNGYHKKVYDCLAPFTDENEKQWLKDACSPL